MAIEIPTITVACDACDTRWTVLLAPAECAGTWIEADLMRRMVAVGWSIGVRGEHSCAECTRKRRAQLEKIADDYNASLKPAPAAVD